MGGARQSTSMGLWQQDLCSIACASSNSDLLGFLHVSRSGVPAESGQQCLCMPSHQWWWGGGVHTCEYQKKRGGKIHSCVHASNAVAGRPWVSECCQSSVGSLRWERLWMDGHTSADVDLPVLSNG